MQNWRAGYLRRSVEAIKRVLRDSTFRDNVRRVQEAIRSTDALSIATDFLERAFDLGDRRHALRTNALRRFRYPGTRDRNRTQLNQTGNSEEL